MKIDELNLDTMIEMFQYVNNKFLKEQKELVLSNVSERAWYTHFAIYFSRVLNSFKLPRRYTVDTEYNRNQGRIKTILDDTQNFEVIDVSCDFIIHSRGKYIEKDNLICIEMKKSTRPEKEKIKDKNRVRILTKNSYKDTYSFDGKSLPEHVCGYILGIYYEIDINKRNVYVEYYNCGEKIDSYAVKF